MTMIPHPPDDRTSDRERRLSSDISQQHDVALSSYKYDGNDEDCEQGLKRRIATGESIALHSSPSGRHAPLRRAKSAMVLNQTIPDCSTRRKFSNSSTSALPAIWQRKMSHSMPIENGRTTRSLTFEEWRTIAENRRKLNELRKLAENTAENQRKENEKRNRFKRRISFEEWLEVKTSKEMFSVTNRKNSLGAMSDEDTSSSPLQKQTTHPQPTTFSESKVDKLTKRVVPNDNSHKEDERMEMAKTAFTKWVIKKELAALSRERQKLLKLRAVFCDSKVISTTA